MGVGIVTPVARAWAAWVWHRQRGFSGTGVGRLTTTSVPWWPPRCEAGAALCAGRWWAQPSDWFQGGGCQFVSA